MRASKHWESGFEKGARIYEVQQDTGLIRPLKGPRARPSAYRDGQNVIRDSGSNAIVYLPPGAKDVPGLMAALVDWFKVAEKEQLPAPVAAGLAHYQFVTIHPYYDGNGRTARLLATFILCRAGYGLNGFLSLEEHHAKDLEAYYHSLAVHPHHNYYEGRAEADLTPWLDYFVTSVASVFKAVREEALQCARNGLPAEPDLLRKLDRRARRVFALFSKQDRITTPEVAGVLGLSDRMARNLVQGWVAEGWLVVAQASKRSRAYGLAESYRQSRRTRSDEFPRLHRRSACRTALFEHVYESYCREGSGILRSGLLIAGCCSGKNWSFSQITEP